MSYFQRAQTWINNNSEITPEQLQQAIDRTAAEASKIEASDNYDQDHLEDLHQTIDLLEQTLVQKLEQKLEQQPVTNEATDTPTQDSSWDTAPLIDESIEAEPLTDQQKKQALQDLLKQGVIKKGI